MEVVVVGGQSIAGDTGRSEITLVVDVIGRLCLLVPICLRSIVGNDVGILVGHHIVALQHLGIDAIVRIEVPHNELVFESDVVVIAWAADSGLRSEIDNVRRRWQ